APLGSVETGGLRRVDVSSALREDRRRESNDSVIWRKFRVRRRLGLGMNGSPQKDRAPRRGWSLLVAAVGVATLAAACGSSSTTSSASSASGKTASINVWWVTNGTNVNDLWSSIATDFDNAHPGDKVTIDIEPSSNSYKTKLLTALGTSSPPTLFFSWGGGPMQQDISAKG